MKEKTNYRKDCMCAGSQGWATWKERWNSVDWDMKDGHQFVEDRKKRNKFKKRGCNMPRMDDLQMQRKD